MDAEQNDMTTSTAEERQRQAAALNHLLGQIGLTAGEQTQWWNLTAYVELAGRTPTQAWLDGDTELVRSLVESWYEASTSSGRRAAGNRELLDQLRRKLTDLDRRYGSTDVLHRSA